MSVLLTKIPNPLNRDISVKVNQDYSPGKTLAYYISGQIPADAPDITWVVSKNGLIVKKDYALVPVKDGDKIAICPRHEGTAAAAAAGYVAGALFTAGTVAYAVAYAVVYLATLFVVGYGMSMLAGAIGGKPEEGGYDADTTYGWNPLEQTYQEGVHIPTYYGTNKVAGHIINQFVKVSDADDEDEILYVLNALCGHDVDSIDNIEINGNPAVNYKDCTTYTRLGTTTDTLIDGFDEIVTQVNVGSEIVQESAVIQQTQGMCEKLGIILSAPYGMYHMDDDGSPATDYFYYTLKYRVTGEATWITVVEGAHFGNKTMSGFKRLLEIDNLDLNYYDVYLIRTNSVVSSAKGRNNVYLASLQEIVKEPLVYPSIAKYAVKILATDQLSGGVPAMTCEASRNYVSVYNPSTETWVNKSATNPAWICYDILIQKQIPVTRILYDEFSTWADFCDYDLGGGEKRIEVNVVIQGGNVWENLQNIAQMGHAVIIRRNTKYGVFIDCQDDTVSHLFTMGNIVENTFAMQYLPKKDRASAIEIEYTDPDRDYTRQVVTVYSNSYITDTSTQQQKTTMSFNAAFTQAQAVREGVYRINSNQFLVRVVQFDAFIDSFACVVGDIFEFQHEAVNYLASDIGGVVSGAGNDNGDGDPYVTLDKPVYLTEGEVYKIRVRLSDDTLVEKTIDTTGIADFGVAQTTLILTQAWVDVPTSDDVYAFGQADTYLKKYRITSVTKKDELTRTIVGLEYVEEIYTNNDDCVIEEPSWVNEKQEAIAVYASEFLTYAVDGSYASNINVSWHRSYTSQSNNWAIWLENTTAGTAPKKIGIAVESQFTITSDYLVVGDSYTIYVTLADQGLVDTGSNSTTITLLGKDAPPGDIADFNGTWDSIRRAVHFTWTDVSDIDVLKYEIRQGAWESEVVVAYSISETATIYIDEGVSETITYRIKAIDTSGNYSENADETSVAIDTSDCALATPGSVSLSSSSTIASDGGDTVTLLATWDTDAELSDDFHHYEVLLENIGTGKTSMYATTGNEYSWFVIPNTQYGVSVRAVDVSGNKTAWSTQVLHTTTGDLVAPDTPTTLTASGTFTSIILNWSHSGEADLSHFNIYRNTVNYSSTSTIIGSCVGEFNSSFGSYNDSPPTTDTYYYWVTAVDTSGNESGRSNSDSAAAEGVGIGPGEITETEIADDAISTPKLRANSVIASKILAGAVGTDHLAANAVTATKINVTNLSAINADMGTITAGRIQNAGNTTYLDLDDNLMHLGSKLTWNGTNLTVNGAVTITSGSSGYSNLSDKPTSLSGVNPTEGTKLSGIAAGATVGAKWGTNITNQPSSLNSINSTEYGYLTNPAGVINSGTTTIDGGKITAYSITGNRMVANTINTGQLAASCITATQVGTNQIIASSANIASAAIGTANIANAAVETIKIQGNAVTIPVFASGGSGTINPSSTNYTTAQQAAIISTGQPITIFVSIELKFISQTSSVTVRVKRASNAEIVSGSYSTYGETGKKTVSFISQATIGAIYDVFHLEVNSPGTTITYQYATLGLLETKR